MKARTPPEEGAILESLKKAVSEECSPPPAPC
jgi:hypothetical protein